jgi:hypothetical protein
VSTARNGFPDGWISLADDPDRGRALAEELTRECGGADHPLYGVRVETVGRCQACDDVAYWVPEQGRWALVHLTWSHGPETDSYHPSCETFDSWAAVVGEMLDRN